MPFRIVRNDITKMKVDAIVNAAAPDLLGGGGVDGAIHEAAGPGLLEECRRLHGCQVGEAKITRAYQLPCRYVIHTVGPVWQGGGHQESHLLASCYHSALELADEKGCTSIAFPFISTGAFHFPKPEALQIAVDTITAFLKTHDMMVYLVVFDDEMFRISANLYADIQSYIDEQYVKVHQMRNRTRQMFEAPEMSLRIEGMGGAESLQEALDHLDESFSKMVLRKIDEKHMTDVECYKKANIDRKLFSKIRSDRDYKPSKTTAIALGLALELPLDEMEDLLEKAGYALSHSSKRDVILEYFIKEGQYDVYKINEALFAFHQKPLASKCRFLCDHFRFSSCYTGNNWKLVLQTGGSIMNENLTEIVFILDRSGSMAGLEADTIGGFNSLIRKQKKEPGRALISTILFDDAPSVLYDRVDLWEIQPMTEKDYWVRGCTALLDAVGGAIHHIGNVHKYARPEDVPAHTLFVITTDGMENASRRYTVPQVRHMIRRQKERYGWEFLFLGANIDAVETASHFGIDEDRAVSFKNDHWGIALNYAAMEEAVSEVRGGRKISKSWKRKIEEDVKERGK